MVVGGSLWILWQVQIEQIQKYWVVIQILPIIQRKFIFSVVDILVSNIKIIYFDVKIVHLLLIGFSTSSIQIVSAMEGKADAWFSYDGITWTKINYEEGGGSSTVPFFSSQEWTSTIVDTKTKYLGNWGLTMEKLKIAGVEVGNVYRS